MFYASGGVYPPAFTSLTFLHLVGAGVLDGPFFTLPSKEYSAPSSAGHFWPQPQK